MAGAAAAALIGAKTATYDSHDPVFRKTLKATQDEDDAMLEQACQSAKAHMLTGTRPKSRVKDHVTLSRSATNNLINNASMKPTQNPGVEVTKGRLFIESHYFNWFIYSIILLNALQMGLQVDFDSGDWKTLWQVLEHVFTAVFVLEMAIKIYILELEYFVQAPGNRWNLLDFFIAWASVIGSWVIPAITGGSTPDSLRVFQFLRLLRIIKVLRMRKDLLALVEGIVNSLKCMMWVSALLVLVTYACGIFFTEAITGDKLDEKYKDLDFDNKEFFGSLWRSMMTLFGMTVLDHWNDIVMPIAVVQPYLIPVFIGFLVLTSFGLLNALIGIIVERTTSAMKAIQDKENAQARMLKLEKVESLVKIVAEIDESGDGVISRAELEAAQDHPEYQRMLDEIDLPPGFKGEDLHLMLDPDGNGELSPEEFINGMYQLIFCNEFQRECLTKHSINHVKHALWSLTGVLQQQLWQIRRDLGTLRGVDLPENPPLDFGEHPSPHHRTKDGSLKGKKLKDRKSMGDKQLDRPAVKFRPGGDSRVSFNIDDASTRLGKKEGGEERDCQVQNRSEVVSPRVTAPLLEEKMHNAQETLSAALYALAQERLATEDGVLIKRVRERMAQVEIALCNLEHGTRSSAMSGIIGESVTGSDSKESIVMAPSIIAQHPGPVKKRMIRRSPSRIKNMKGSVLSNSPKNGDENEPSSLSVHRLGSLFASPTNGNN